MERLSSSKKMFVYVFFCIFFIGCQTAPFQQKVLPLDYHKTGGKLGIVIISKSRKNNCEYFLSGYGLLDGPIIRGFNAKAVTKVESINFVDILSDIYTNPLTDYFSKQNFEIKLFPPEYYFGYNPTFFFEKYQTKPHNLNKQVTKKIIAENDLSSIAVLDVCQLGIMQAKGMLGTSNHLHYVSHLRFYLLDGSNQIVSQFETINTKQVELNKMNTKEYITTNLKGDINRILNFIIKSETI